MIDVRAWELDRSSSGPALRLVERDAPEPGPGEVLVKVEACGVCRTDLHLAAGELPLRRAPIVPGHEVVGTVVSLGPAVERLGIGDRVGIAWLRHTCGRCPPCRRGDENLCEGARFTGWDEDGGWAELTVVEEAWAYRLPEALDALHAAPLLCAGIIGYRALRRADLPPAGELGLFGFGGSAHLTAQIARASGHRVHVFTRAASAQEQAQRLGAASAGPPDRPSPVPLDAVIVFSPDGRSLLRALELTRPGGTVVAAGIHVEGIPPLDYQRQLFGERCLTTATANTKGDGEALLRLAARLPLQIDAVPYRFDQAPAALADLAAHRFVGAAVLDLSEE